MNSIPPPMRLDLTQSPVLQTERLILRLPVQGDFESLAMMYGDPDVMRFIGSGMPLDRCHSWRSLAALVGHWVLRGYGMFVVEERTSGRVLGRVGPYFPEGWPDLELGWALAREAWGQGIATEAAQCVRNYMISTLAPQRIISVIHPDNRRSIRVAEKLGARLAEARNIDGIPCRIYEHPRNS